MSMGSGPADVRVALVAPSLLVGGLERVVRDLAVGLLEHGFRTAVFTTGPGGPYADELRSHGVPVTCCDRPRPRSLRIPLELLRRLKQFGPAIIHGHSGTWLPCSTARWALGYPRLVFTDHGRYLPEPSSRAFVERHVYLRNTERLIAVSRELASYLQSFLGLPAAPQVIPNGVDLREYGDGPERRASLRSEWNIRGDEVLALAVGRLEPVKNHRGLLVAAAEARKFEPRLRVGIVGTGRIEQELHELAVELGIRDTTLFLGQRNDVADCLRAADLFVSSSTSEGLPVALLEALASGLPILATAVGGIPDALGSPAAGVLVPAGEDASMAAELVRLARDPGARAGLGLAARRRAQRYSLDACLRSYAEVYREVLAAETGGVAPRRLVKAGP